MKIETLELKGYVCVHDDDVYLEKERKDEEDYYYPDIDSIGEIIADTFIKLSKPVDVSYADWTRGSYVGYKDVFCRYYISDKEITWDEINEEHIKHIVGGLDTEKRYAGYSEYTVTESWTELLVGGHDLRKELKSYKDKYVLIKIDYKIIN